MIKLFLALASLASVINSYSQADTALFYYTKDYRQTLVDRAFVILKMFKNSDQWIGRETYKRNGVLKSEGAYAVKDPKTPVGTFKNFNERGVLDYEAAWGSDSKIQAKTFYYKNGSKKSYIGYSDKLVLQQKGWDEEGKEIKNYVVEREARFKGGIDGWRKYLEKKLNANVAADAGAPVGQYEVKVMFVVNREGYVSLVKAVEIPKACKPCAAEAVNVISSGPDWEPAIQNNEPVVYNAIQFITFVVDEGSGKKKKG